MINDSLIIDFVTEVPQILLENLFTFDSFFDGMMTMTGVLLFVTAYRSFNAGKKTSITGHDLLFIRRNWLKQLNCYSKSLSMTKFLCITFVCSTAITMFFDKWFISSGVSIFSATLFGLLTIKSHPRMMHFKPSPAHPHIEWMFHLSKDLIEPHLDKSVYFEKVDKDSVREKVKEYAFNIHSVAEGLGQDIRIATPMSVRQLIRELERLGWKAERSTSVKTPFMTRFFVARYRKKSGKVSFGDAWKSCGRLHRYHLTQGRPATI